MDLELSTTGPSVAAALEEGRLDLAIGRWDLAPLGLRRRTLYREQLVSVVRADHPQVAEALVYVAGYLPQDGQSLLDLAFMDPGSILGEHIVDHGDGTASIDANFIGEVFCADSTDDDVTLLQDRQRPEAFGPLATPVTLTDAAFGSLPRFYLHTAQDMAVSPILQDQMIAASPVDGEATLDTSHSPMLVDPDGLAAQLMAFVP